MKIKIVVSALLISAATMAAVTPASANWFHNKYLGISRNVGSAPNPTPDDVRQGRLPIIVQQENNRPGLFTRIGALLRGEQTQPRTANRVGIWLNCGADVIRPRHNHFRRAYDRSVIGNETSFRLTSRF